MTALAPIFSVPTKIAKLVLVNTKAGKTGFQSLAKAFKAGRHGLTFLNLSKNAFGDDGIKILAGNDMHYLLPYY
jgi:hypothetical protein